LFTAMLALALVAVCTGAAGALAATPNDPSFSLQWADSNTGQSIPTQSAEGEQPLGPPAGGTAGADDRALAAWEVSTGSRAIVIGELDSGVQYTHPDLAANMWSNPGGIGGCPAGTHGFDALDSTCYPQDEDESYGGHGTHVAGVMGAVGDNRQGVAGVNWRTSILAVKWVRSAGAEGDDLLAALQWLLKAREEGVDIRVVNDSLTFFGTPYSTEVKREIELLGEHGVLFVTAAGNTGNNDDQESVRRYPCGYHLPNEICVTATNNNDKLPTWANYGPHTVDLAAPGVSIYSTLREGRYGYLSGGSMASAEVAGAAALILAAEPGLTARQLKADILGNVHALPALAGKVITGGRLDVCKAMPGCEAPPKPTLAAAAASSVTATSATLSARVNPNGGEVSTCRFEYGTSSEYGASVQCRPMPGSGRNPVEVSAPAGGLSPTTTYHFRIVASNAGGTSAGSDQTFTTPVTPPTVAGAAASALATTSATLTASVNPDGGEVSECRFEYGPSSAYGASVECQPMPGSGTSPVAVSASIGALSPLTTYHFRIVASNPGGTSAGTDQAFTTPPNPPTVATLAASSLAATSATLNASVNPEGAETSACRFDYGPSGAYVASAQCQPMPGNGTTPLEVSASIAGLSPNTTYHFRVVASNAGGTSAGSEQTFTSPSTPTMHEAPPAASPLSAGVGAVALVNAGQGSNNSQPPPPLPVVVGAALTESASGSVRVILRCPAGVGVCAGTIILRLRPARSARPHAGGRSRNGKSVRPLVTVALSSYAIAAGSSAALDLVLSRTGRRAFAGARRVSGQVTLLAREPSGAELSARLPVTLQREANLPARGNRAAARSGQPLRGSSSALLP
jgi:subtilase family protein